MSDTMDDNRFAMSEAMQAAFDADAARVEAVRRNGTPLTPRPAPTQTPRRVTGLASPTSTPTETARDDARRARWEYRKARAQEFGKRHGKFMAKLYAEPLTVRLLAVSVHYATLWAIHGVHWYAKGRAFILAHLGGWCATSVRDERRAVCDDCDRQYTRDGHSHCRECNCPAWPGSRITHKVRLAWFSCDAGKFGRAHSVWWRMGRAMLRLIGV